MSGMNGQLFGLGPFRFRILGPSVDRLTHQTEARWASIGRLQREPARQFIGPARARLSWRPSSIPAKRKAMAS